MKYRKYNSWQSPYYVYIRIPGGWMPPPVTLLDCGVSRGRNFGWMMWSYETAICSIRTLKDRKKNLVVGYKNWGRMSLGTYSGY